MAYEHSKIKDLIISPTGQALAPLYENNGIQKRSTDNSAEDLEDKAISVADRVMSSSDPKLALDAAKAAMQWLGKGSKARTTIFANNAQVNQLSEDPDKGKYVLESLKESIGLLVQGTQIRETILEDEQS
jgi:hypothetical protein